MKRHQLYLANTRNAYSASSLKLSTGIVHTINNLIFIVLTLIIRNIFQNDRNDANMVLTQQEQQGFAALLQQIPAADLLSLVDTVCMKKITVTNKPDAIKAITAYSSSAAELLKRRKVKKDYIFSYLNCCNIRIQPSESKFMMVNVVLRHWGSKQITQQEFETMDVDYDYNNVQPQPATNVFVCIQNFPKPQDQDSLLCSQFCDWFYNMLNSYHPLKQEAQKQNFGPHHFYDDVSLKLRVIAPNSHDQEVTGALAVCQRLLQFPQKEMVLFNPNLESDGFKVTSEPHGLKTLTVCGTVHQESGVVGLFEQQFGIIKDIHIENNWKIKFTKLRLQVGAASGRPSLDNMRQILSIASS